MGGACNTHRSNEKCIQTLGLKTRKEIYHLEYSRRWDDNIKRDLK
jgi:hypothetical protein